MEKLHKFDPVHYSKPNTFVAFAVPDQEVTDFYRVPYIRVGIHQGNEKKIDLFLIRTDVWEKFENKIKERVKERGDYCGFNYLIREFTEEYVTPTGRFGR